MSGRFVTVSCNPAYDVTYEVDDLRPGEVHRVRHVRTRAGGKGVNVATVLRQLGETVVATGVADAAFTAEVAALGVTPAFVTGVDQVRRTVVVSAPGLTTSFWEPGSTLGDGDAFADRLLARVTGLPGRALVVSGSVGGLPADLPARLAADAVRRGVPVVVDTSGAALRAAADVRGVVLMPNQDELAELAGHDDPVRAGRTLVAAGAAGVVATRGRAGVVITTGDGCWRALPPYEMEGNPTGAGDAAAAAVARALACGSDPETVAREAVALSAAAVATPTAGSVDEELYHRLRAEVTVERLEG